MRSPDHDPDRLAAAARAVLARDGVDLALRPWQVGYLLALADGHPADVPTACGLGRGWVQARLDDALAGLELGLDGGAGLRHRSDLRLAHPHRGPSDP